MTASRTVDDAGAVGVLFAQDEVRTAPPVFLPRREVERRVGLSRTTIYERIAAKTFPQPVRDLETGTVWWLESEVIAWQRARITRRDRTDGACMGTGMGRSAPPR